MTGSKPCVERDSDANDSHRCGARYVADLLSVLSVVSWLVPIVTSCSMFTIRHDKPGTGRMAVSMKSTSCCDDLQSAIHAFGHEIDANGTGSVKSGCHNQLVYGTN